MADEQFQPITDPNDPRLANIPLNEPEAPAPQPVQSISKDQWPGEPVGDYPGEAVKLDFPEAKPDLVTFYYPATPQETRAAGLSYGMEGGIHGAGRFSDIDLRNHTLEQYKAGNSDFVAVAMAGHPTGDEFALNLHGSPVWAKQVDTGGGLRLGQIDVATSTPQLAKTGTIRPSGKKVNLETFTPAEITPTQFLETRRGTAVDPSQEPWPGEKIDLTPTKPRVGVPPLLARPDETPTMEPQEITPALEGPGGRYGQLPIEEIPGLREQPAFMDSIKSGNIGQAYYTARNYLTDYFTSASPAGKDAHILGTNEQIPPSPNDSLPVSVAKSVVNVGNQTMAGATSPEMVTMLGATAATGGMPVVSRLVSGAFLADLSSQLPRLSEDINKAEERYGPHSQQAIEARLRLLTNGAFIALTGHGVAKGVPGIPAAGPAGIRPTTTRVAVSPPGAPQAPTGPAALPPAAATARPARPGGQGPTDVPRWFNADQADRLRAARAARDRGEMTDAEYETTAQGISDEHGEVFHPDIEGEFTKVDPTAPLLQQVQQTIDNQLAVRTQSPKAETSINSNGEFIDVPFVKISENAGTTGERVKQFLDPPDGTRPSQGLELGPHERIPAPLVGYPVINHANGSRTIVNPASSEEEQPSGPNGEHLIDVHPDELATPDPPPWPDGAVTTPYIPAQQLELRLDGLNGQDKIDSTVAAAADVGSPAQIQTQAQVLHDLEGLGITEEERARLAGPHYVVANPTTGQIHEIVLSRDQGLDYLRSQAAPGEVLLRRADGVPDQVVAQRPDDVVTLQDREIAKVKKATGKEELSGADFDPPPGADALRTPEEITATAERILSLPAGKILDEMKRLDIPSPRAQRTWDKARYRKPGDETDWDQTFYEDVNDDLNSWAKKMRAKMGKKPPGGFAEDLGTWQDFGRQIYQKGMQYAEWAGQMLKQFGEAVRRHLQGIWEDMQKLHAVHPAFRRGVKMGVPEGHVRRATETATRAGHDIAKSNYERVLAHRVSSETNGARFRANVPKAYQSRSDVQQINNAITFFRGNLVKAAQAALREPWAKQAAKQYQGYNIYSHDLANRFGYKPEDVMLAESAQSPNASPDNSFEATRRLMKMLRDDTEHVFDERMENWARNKTYINSRMEKAYLYTPAEVDYLVGKKFSELPKGDYAQAQWMRAYDEMHHPDRLLRVVRPDGTLGDTVKTSTGKDQPFAWTTFSPMQNAIDALQGNATPEAILSTPKVANYYMSKLLAFQRSDHVVADTHHTSAAWGNSLPSSHPLVKDVFAAGRSVKDGKFGGYYSIVHEATVQAAKELRMDPKELQATVWSYQRGLKSPDSLGTTIAEAIQNLWEGANRGNVTEREAYEGTEHIAREFHGGVPAPGYFGERPGSERAPSPGTSGQPAELPARGGVPGSAGRGGRISGASGVARGAGTKAAVAQGSHGARSARVSSPVARRDFFIGIRRTHKEHPWGKSVTVFPEAFYKDPGTQLFLSKDKLAGAAVSPDGELVSVFKHPKSTGDMKEILTEASDHAAYLMGFESNGRLPELYSKYGFRPIARLPFDPAMAPKGWTPEQGTPDVMFMVRDPKNKLRLPDVAKNGWAAVRDQVPVVTYDKAQSMIHKARAQVVARRSEGGFINVKAIAEATKRTAERSRIKDALLSRESATDNMSNVFSWQRSNMVRRDFGTAAQGLKKGTKAFQDLEALSLVEEAGFDKAELQRQRNLVVGAKHEKEFLPKYDYALREFDRIARNPGYYRSEMDAQLAREKHAGLSANDRAQYVPHMYAQEPKGLFGNLFSSSKPGAGTGSARWFTKGRTFATLADAIKAGFRPKSLNAADLAQVRIRDGQRLILQKYFREQLKTMNYDGRPLAVDNPQRGYRTITVNGVPVHVAEDLSRYVSMLFEPSAVRGSAFGRGALTVVGTQKQVLLGADTFHAARLSLYNAGAGAGRTRAGFKRGLSVLELAPEDYNRAIASGEFSPAEVQYARQNRPLMLELLSQGANIAKWGDNIVGDLHRVMPGLRGLNSFIFDSIGRGSLMQGLLANYKRVLSRFPELSREQAARKAVTEMNEMFGNMGRRSVFKHRTFQDIGQFLLLARNWVESQFKSEIRAYGQMAAYPYNVAEGLVRGQGAKSFSRLGVTAQSRLSLALGLFVAGQILNYVLNKQSTFDNEDGHKLDVKIPKGTLGLSKNYYFDPAQIPFEFTHQTLKYMRKGEGLLGAATHIAFNKLASLPRATMAAFGVPPYRGAPAAKPGIERARQVASTMVSPPIISGGFIEPEPRSPWLFRLNRRPDAIMLQGAASLGAKLEPEEAARDKVYTMVREKGFEKPDEQIVSGKYSQLKRALTNQDQRAVKEEFGLLMKEAPTRADKLKMVKGIKESLGVRSIGGMEKFPEKGSTNPLLFTGSVKDEIKFKRALNPQEKLTYREAQQDHVQAARYFKMLLPQLRLQEIH